MKAFVSVVAIVASVSGAPQIFRGAGQVSHQSVSKPFQGEHRATTQSKAFGATVAAVADHPNALHGARHGVVAHPHPVSHGVLSHGLVGHGVAHSVAPVAHAAPLVHAAPVLAHPAPAYGPAEVYPDEVSPYTYNYAVADDYSASNFQAAESSDGTGNAEGSYSVNLPDGRTQHVNYHSDPVGGYVAEVTYDGEAAYPDVIAHPAPVHAVAHHAAPVVHAAHAVAHPVARVAHASPVVHSAPVYRPSAPAVVHAAPVVAHAAPVVHAAHAVATPVIHAAVHAAPVYRGAGQVSHQSVSKPFQGEHRATTQSKAFGANIAAVHDSPSPLNGAHSRNGLAVVGHGAVIG